MPQIGKSFKSQDIFKPFFHFLHKRRIPEKQKMTDRFTSLSHFLN